MVHVNDCELRGMVHRCIIGIGAAIGDMEMEMEVEAGWIFVVVVQLHAACRLAMVTDYRGNSTFSTFTYRFRDVAIWR